MKKITTAGLVLTAAMLLSACGTVQTIDVQPTPAPTAAVEAAPEASAPQAPQNMISVLPGSADVPADEPEATPNPGLLKAKELIGRSTEELVKAIGEPMSKDYASSCLGPGEDGEWQYEGFTVYTYKEGDREVVQDAA